jgi:flagellar hook-associated protein 3 FlgL
MRITQSTLTNSFLRNLSKNLEHMQSYHDKLTSRKEVSKPSDDPLLVAKIMDMTKNIKQNEQYNSNISDTLGWVETQDTALNDATATLNRVRDLMIYGSNGSLSETDRLAIKDEVEMQVEQIADILNTNFDGRYIFAGQKTNDAPFEVDSGVLKYGGDNNNISREISQGVEIDLVTSGSELTVAEGTSTDENKDLGVFLNKVVNALKDGKPEDLDNISEDFLGDIDKHIDNVIRVRSKVGAINNRLEASKERNEAENLNLNKVLSEREDIDIAEKYMEFITMSTVYQASLSIGSKVMQPSLLDYMR